MARCSAPLYIFPLAVLASQISAETFLRASPTSKIFHQATMFTKLANSIDSTRLDDIRKVIRPMYAALSKNKDGNLDRGGVSYALHRYFVERHGWYVKGLMPSNGPWSSLSPEAIVKDRVPAYVHDLFMQRLVHDGFGMDELTVFAATLEGLVRQEGLDQLAKTYDYLRVNRSGRSPPEHVYIILNAYMMSYVTGGVLANITPSSYKYMDETTEAIYPLWPEIKIWLRDMQNSASHAIRHRFNAFASNMSFNDVAYVLDVIGHNFGRFQALDCHEMKNVLMERELQGSGRVRLAQFYSYSHDGRYEFKESVDYLRRLGALDETVPEQTSVIIPNYINSLSNCIAPSGFYAVCCRDECETLLAHLEKNIAAPEAPPGIVADLVANLASETMDAPRNLSAPLLRRLHEIADHHGGRVPLHGRLFSQWMHHAYPRECGFPHVAGTTAPIDLVAIIRSGEDPSVSDEDLLRHHTQVNLTVGVEVNLAVGEFEDTLPWNAVEELVVVRRESSQLGNAVLKAMAMVIATLFASALGAAVRTFRFTTLDDKLDKHFV